MSGDLVPEEAIEAAERALCGGGEEQYTVHVTHHDVAATALQAAAPLILAAAYGRLADELAAERDSGRFGLSGSFGSGMQRAVLKIQQARASVLRGEGHRDA